ncbi:MAG: STAS domain-containing protein [Aulosira sp. DedQUE10]|nr:STAS domain-containing protein [Aulosira sp. DedQUE10]
MKLTVKVLEISGILDGIRGNELRSQVRTIVANGADILLLDLKEVKFMDSSGLGALISAMQMVKNANGKFFVCSISDQVRMLFELTKLDIIFQNFADQEDFNRHVLAIELAAKE